MPILDKTDKKKTAELNKFFKTSQYGNYYQSPEWAEIKSDNWKNEYVYLEENREIVAGMLILIRKIAKGFTMMYSTRGPVADFNNISQINKLIKEVEPLVKKYKPFVLKMDPEIEEDEEIKTALRKSGFKVKSDFKNILELMQTIRTMELDIENKTEEEIMAEYSQKTRYNIRVAIKKGVKVRYSNSEDDLKKFYKLMQVTAKRDQIAVRSYEYYKKIVDAYKDNARIYIAEYNGEPLAAAIAINYAKKVTYFYGASSNENRNLMPCYIMQQTMIEWAIETKCKAYDFGGIFNTTKDNGLYRFKEGFCRKKGATKFIGEIDKVYNKPKYFIFSKVLPKVKGLMLFINSKKQKIKNKSKN